MKKILFLVLVLIASATGAGWWTASRNVVLTNQQPVIIARAQQTQVAGAVDYKNVPGTDIELNPGSEEFYPDASLDADIEFTPFTTIAENLGSEKIVFDQSTGKYICLTENSCSYAAVDKSHALPADYTPAVVPVDVQGRAYLIPEAAFALEKLLAAAADRDIDAKVTSSYRSYATQEATFNSWVNSILAKNPGYTNQEARLEANTFSALPGYSEHQLGTTVDLNTVGATAFNETQNSNLYSFIEKNAHRFGFVLTYPKGMQEVTGYVHEPWHVRFVGTDVAAGLFDTGYIDGNGNFSTKYLRDNGYSD